MSYQLVSSNLFVSAPFAEEKTMAAQIKPILQSDSAISTHLANAMLKKGSDDANSTSGIVSLPISLMLLQESIQMLTPICSYH